MKCIGRLPQTAAVLAAGLLIVGSGLETTAAPDPEIFDGSKYEQEAVKRYAIQKILDMTKVNLPTPGARQSGEMPSSGQTGIYAQQGGTGMGGLGGSPRSGMSGQESKPGAISMGSKGDQIDPNAHGKAIGRELAEVDQRAMESGKNAGNQASKSQGKEGRQGGQQQGQMNGMQGANSVTLGSKEEMIEVAQQSGTQEDPGGDADGGAVGDEEMLDSKGPEMRGKNKGRSVGVETGQSIPTDL